MTYNDFCVLIDIPSLLFKENQYTNEIRGNLLNIQSQQGMHA